MAVSKKKPPFALKGLTTDKRSVIIMATYRQNASYDFISKKPWDPATAEIIDDEGGTTNKNALPFGLCKKFGISLPDGARPRDAWEALKQHGVYPPWTDEGEDQYTEDGLKEGAEEPKKGEEKPKKLKEFSDFSDTYNAPKWANTEETKKKIASAIDYVYSKYNLEKLTSVNVKAMRNAFASAGGTRLNIASSFLKDPEGSAKKSQDDFDMYKTFYLKRYEIFLEKATTDEEKAQWQKEIDETKAYSRFDVIYSGDAFQSVVAHELGHTLSEQYFGLITYRNIYGEPKGKVYPEAARKKIRDAFRECKQNGEIYKISKYASTSVDEFFAESFAMKIMGKEELPPTVKKLFEEIL